MRERVWQRKKATTASSTFFSTSTLKKPTRGFGIDSSRVPQAVTTGQQPLNKPRSYDLSRISMRPQAKLTVSHPGDVYEQEADRVARQVMRVMNKPANQQSVQREAMPEQEEEEKLQTKSLANTITPLAQREQMPQEEEEEQLQTKSLANTITPLVQREQMPQEEEEEQLQTTSLANTITPLVQREQMPQEEEEQQAQMKPFGEHKNSGLVQRKPGGGRMKATSDVESSIQQARGGGQPLSDDIRQPMEQAFGTDFSGVKIHTDPRSHELNESIQARAFTTGQDIFFRQGEYSPGSHSGKELLAHELTHVVQQNGSAVQAKSISHQASKENKVQIKAVPTKSSGILTPKSSENHKAIPSKSSEIPSTSNSQENSSEEDKQGQLEKADLEANVVQGEQQGQSPAKKGGLRSPPDEGGAATDPPPDGSGAEASGNPSETKNGKNKQGKQKSNAAQIENQQASDGQSATATENALTPSTAPTNQPSSDGMGVRTEGQTSSIVPQQAAPLNTEDPGQIIEQLKNTPPTQTFAAYTEAQNASGKALENQKQQVQATIPEIPAPTGLSPKTVEAPPGEKSAPEKPQQAPPEQAAVKGEDKPPEQEEPKQEEPKQEEPKQENQDPNINSINTSVGERPKVDMSGDADPSQMDEEQAQSLEQVQAAKGKEASGISRDFGENKIFPKASKETLKANKELSGCSFDSGKGVETPRIPDEVVGGLNQGLTPYYQAKIAPEQQKYLTGKQQFDVDSGNARENSNQQITSLNQEAKQKQLEQQKQTQQEVAQARQDWQSELDNKEKDYQDKAGKATKEQQQKIDNEKAKGEQEADQKITEAEQEAADKKKQAEEEAAKEKEKSERKSGWDKFVGFFKDIWDGIKKAVNAIFDFVRKAIKAIFEAVKKVVTAIIDAVRTVIVGLIKAFGEILKGLVKIVFAAFPEISKKFTDAIDKAVNKATEIVNSVADFLQKAVSTVLDFLANTLDKLLGLVQGIYNAVMTVIGMVITGEFAELIKRFGNLIEGAKAMPPQFETAALEELMGGGELDLDKPLSPAELAQAQQAGVSIPGMEGENTPETGEAGEMPSAPWSEENVGVDTVEDNMELSPEIAEELMQQTNGEGEVMLAESQEQSRSMEAIMSEVSGEQQVGGEQEQHIPDDGLTPKQRASIKWELMKQGIKEWFSKNWPILLAALIAAAAVIIAAIVASGGAILSALPIIMEILAIVFAAEAIARIGGYLSDYLSKSWEGDIQGGGKSLAKALAAGAIELVMLLTFEAGKLATKGVKAAAKGVTKVATKATQAIAKGAKYIIQKGKVLFKGIAGTRIGKQFKKLGDLGKALLDRMRFKAFRIRVANRRFRLEGLINPWVLIAEGEFKELKSKPSGENQRNVLNVTDEQLALLKQGKEITLPKLKSYEQARNKAYDLIGGFVPNSEPLIGRLGVSAGKGKIIGFQSADRKVRVRLDYDPQKGTHFNVEDFRAGKGNAIKIAVPFEGDEKTFKSYLNFINKTKSFY